MRSEFFALANANETQRSSAKWNERTQARKRREQMAQVNLEIVLNSNFAERNRMDTTLQDTLFSLTGIKLSIRCMSAFRKSCLPDSLKAESKCKNPKFHTAIATFMPVCPS